MTLDASAGQAVITLRMVLDDLPVQGEEVKKPSQQGSRNGPSRTRRREKRAAARLVAAENAAAEVSPEEAELLVLAEEAELSTKAEEAKEEKVKRVPVADKETNTENVEDDTAEEADVPDMELEDEVCTDESYGELKNKNPCRSPPPTPGLETAAPPPTSSRGLGGIDYYTTMYDEEDYG